MFSKKRSRKIQSPQTNIMKPTFSFEPQPGTLLHYVMQGNAEEVKNLLLKDVENLKQKSPGAFWFSMGTPHCYMPFAFKILKSPKFSLTMAQMLMLQVKYLNCEFSSLNLIGYTPIIWAARYNNLLIVDLLLKSGATACCSNQNGFTPFIYAAHNGNIDMCIKIYESGGWIHSREQCGSNALMCAALAKRKCLCRLLLEWGCDQYNGCMIGSSRDLIEYTSIKKYDELFGLFSICA